MRIGFHVTWARQESAYMAGQLADLATTLGHSVSILSMQICGKQDVYARWDRDVKQPGEDFEAWCKKQRTLIWFDCRPEKVRIARKHGVRNVLIPLWHRITADELPLLGMFNRVVCPSPSVARLIEERLIPCGLRVAEWDPQTPFGRPPIFDGMTRVFVPLESAALVQGGLPALTSLQLLAECSPSLHFTIGQCRHWPRAAMNAVTGLLQTLPKQFAVYRRSSWGEWERRIAGCDWLLNLNPNENSNLHTLAAGYSRVAVAAFDVAPVSDLIRHDKNGVLIPCNLTENSWGVPSAVPSLKKLLDALDGRLHNRQVVSLLSGTDMPAQLSGRRVRFREFWERELEQTDQWA